MSGIGKIFVVLNLVFSLVIVGAAAAYLAKADDWKAQYDELNEKYTSETKAMADEQANLQERLRVREEENNDKQNQIEDLELQASTAKDELKNEKVDGQQLRDDVTKINSVLEDFQTNMNDLNNRNSELADQNASLRNDTHDAQGKQREAEQSLTTVQSELDRANEQIQTLEKKVAELDKELADVSNVLETAKTKGFDTSDIVPVPEIPAIVEEVNNELGFVILNVGADDEVKKGYAFHVFRGDEYLGEVIVDDIYPDRSAARIKFQVAGAQFRANDEANTVL